MDLIALGVSKVVVTATYPDGSPGANLKVNGLLSDSGETVFTNSNGKAEAYFSGTGSHELSVSYADVSWNSTVNVVNGNAYCIAAELIQRDTVSYSSSQIIIFSPNIKTIDFAMIGGGSGGGMGYGTSISGNSSGGYTFRAIGGSGGNPGSVVYYENQSVIPGTEYQFNCGSGGKGATGKTFYGEMGSGASAGTAGGASSFMGKTAAGGSYPTFTPSSGKGASAAVARGSHPAENYSATKGISGMEYFGMTLGGGGGGGGAVNARDGTDSLSVNDTSSNGYSVANSSNAAGGGNGGSGGQFYGTIGSPYGGNGNSGSHGGGGGGGGIIQYPINSSYRQAQGATGNGGNGGSGYLRIKMHTS